MWKGDELSTNGVRVAMAEVSAVEVTQSKHRNGPLAAMARHLQSGVALVVASGAAFVADVEALTEVVSVAASVVIEEAMVATEVALVVIEVGTAAAEASAMAADNIPKVRLLDHAVEEDVVATEVVGSVVAVHLQTPTATALDQTIDVVMVAVVAAAVIKAAATVSHLAVVVAAAVAATEKEIATLTASDHTKAAVATRNHGNEEDTESRSWFVAWWYILFTSKHVLYLLFDKGKHSRLTYVCTHKGQRWRTVTDPPH